MKITIKKENIYIILLFIGVLAITLVLLNDWLQGKAIQYGYSELFGLIYGSLFSLSCLILITFRRYNLYASVKLLSKKVFFIELMLILVLVASLLGVGNSLYDCYHYESSKKWSIGIYSSNSSEPFGFCNATEHNPVLTCDDIDDISASFVADPFLIHRNDSYFMFFEIMNEANGQGDIGLAISSDGYNWSYKQIVLDEAFHLSYPCVFEWKGDYYMVPESYRAKSIRLYKANDFPYNWSFVKTLIKGENFVDNTIFCYNNTWWIFTQTFTHKNNNDILELYYSDTLLGPWIKHPQSPIINGDANISRPGGNVVLFDDRLVRYTQDCDPYYGNQVWAFEIVELSKELYVENRVGNKPILKGFEYWNTRGMHQLSPCRINDTRWIAAVDGY